MKTLFRAGIALLLCLLMSLACAEETRWAEVSLSGGTGKVRLASPAEVRGDETGWTAVLCWSSKNYDYMLVDGVRYDPVSTESGSVFEIPIPSPDCTLPVQADTIAMSEPHLIDYVLTFGGRDEAEPAVQPASVRTEGIDLPMTEIPLKYACGFRLAALQSGGWLITVGETDRFLLLPEGVCAPEGLPEDVTVLSQPLDRIYLSASGVMDMFIACGAMESLRFSSLKRNDWQLEEAAAAMESGRLQYAGKYSAPDYELLYAGGCDLAIENTMIYHAPKAAEELKRLGIPVLIDHSSGEDTPQGRMEWIKLYGLLTGRYARAEAFFDRQAALIDRAEDVNGEGPKVAFFYITSGGQVSVRSANDYIPYLIGRAGGRYAFDGYGTDSGNASAVIRLEDFLAEAYDADYVIYNGTIVGELKTLDDFLGLSPLFAGMKAVRQGKVFCTARNMYQSSMRMGELMNDLVVMLRGGNEFQFLYPLK